VRRGIGINPISIPRYRCMYRDDELCTRTCTRTCVCVPRSRPLPRPPPYHGGHTRVETRACPTSVRRQRSRETHPPEHDPRGGYFRRICISVFPADRYDFGVLSSLFLLDLCIADWERSLRAMEERCFYFRSDRLDPSLRFLAVIARYRSVAIYVARYVRSAG